MKNKKKNSSNKKHHDNYLYRQSLQGYKPVNMMMSIQQRQLLENLKKLPAGISQFFVNDFLHQIQNAAKNIYSDVMEPEWNEDFQKEFSVGAGDRE